MHELALARAIVGQVSAAAAPDRVRRVVVEVGAARAVLPDALRFGFDAAALDSNVEGATLEVVEVPWRIRCRSCRAESTPAFPLVTCPCGSSSADVLAGRELLIKEMEVLPSHV